MKAAGCKPGRPSNPYIIRNMPKQNLVSMKTIRLLLMFVMLSANKWKISLRQQRQQDYCCHLLTARSRRARIIQTIPHTWLTRLSEYKVKHLFRTRCQRKQSLTYISLFTSYLDIICLIACISDTSFAYNQKVDCQEVDSLNNKEYVTISLETCPSDSLTAGR